MRVMITGGSGLIGQALSKSLLADGHEVVIVSRDPKAHQRLPKGAEAIGWKHQTLDEFMEGVDAIVNLAGASIAGESPTQMRWTPKRKYSILDSRIQAGEKISQALEALDQKPKALIQSSAIGYYGPQADDIIDESHPNGDDFLAVVCQNWENSTRAVEALGVRRAIIRTGLVFSGEGGIFPLLKLPFSLFVGGPLGDGGQYLSWIHIDDMVDAIRFLIEDGEAQGVFNLTAPNPVTNNAFARVMGEVMRKPAALRVPAFAVKFALGEAATLALDGQRVMPERLIESGFNFRYETLETALSSLL